MKGNRDFKIEKGVPIPENRHKKTGITQALRKLGAKESLLVSDMRPGTLSRAAAYALGAGNYAVRQTKTGVRVWRIK